MTECDTLLMVGSGFPYSEFLPEEGQARGVQIDIEPDMLSLRYPMELNLVGDAAETLRLLLPLLNRKEDRKWRGEIEKQGRRLVEALGGAGDAARETRQSAARSVGAVVTLARQRDRDQRFRAPVRTGTRGT